MENKPVVQQKRNLTFAQQGQQRLEDEAVKTLIAAMKLPIRSFHTIKDIAKNRSSESDLLMLSDFYEHVPDFPLDLVCAPDDNLRSNASLGQVFCLKNFIQYKFYRELLEFRKSRRIKSPVGVLIRWPYMADLMCAHTASVTTEPPYSYMAVRISEDLPEIKLEPLKQLVQSIYSERF